MNDAQPGSHTVHWWYRRVSSGQESAAMLAVALEGLSRYKLRTSLSVLGVVLGVAAVIAMMSVSEGASREALRQIEALGLENLVLRNKITAGRRSGGLTVQDAVAVQTLVPLVGSVSPLVERPLSANSGGRTVFVNVLGVRPAYGSILRLQLASGRFLSAADEQRNARVCVLGMETARRLFGFADPVGRVVRLNDDYFEVIGTLSPHGAQSPLVGAIAWRDLNASVIVPLPALLNRGAPTLLSQPVDEIWLRTTDGEQVGTVAALVQSTMRVLHRGAGDVEVVTPRELLAQRTRTQRTFAVVVGSIAAIALLVGGIGIMNIMLTSVVERTSEIGIRRTVGATRADIALQFLVESVLMTLSGGLMGVLLGVGCAVAITAYAGWNTFVSMLAVLLAVSVSILVGVGFGLYPAVTASRLQPVEALRYE